MKGLLASQKIAQQIKMKLVRTTKSICPVCYRIIDAKLYEENGAVCMEKSCAEHGTFKDLCWSDYQLYK